MNRITQLAVESDLIEWDILPSGVRTPNHEDIAKVRKFAELIVRECVQVIDDMADPEDSERYFWAIQNAIQKIKQHFGVES